MNSIVIPLIIGGAAGWIVGKPLAATVAGAVRNAGAHPDHAELARAATHFGVAIGAFFVARRYL